jgi:hypothetical protein
VNCARWDLCGGYRVTGIPTVILGRQRPVANFASRRSPKASVNWEPGGGRTRLLNGSGLELKQSPM